MWLAIAACGPAAVERGTFEPARWPSMYERSAAALGGTSRIGETAILEGDGELISGIGDGLGIRFDEEENDLGRVMARYVAAFGEVPRGTLVFFTTFEDRGAAGPAYFVPVWNQTSGTGMRMIDQRADFGTASFEGIVNMKQLDAHEAVMRDLAHEVAHRHLAYMRTSTVITGRQDAHWHAALSTDASLLGGYAWRATTGDRFVVTEEYARFSELDLYGLGLLDAAEVSPFFFIEDARTESGARIPPAAELNPGSIVVGRRLPLAIEEVIAAIGPRERESQPMRLVFAVLTAPGESATSTRAVELATRVDALIGDFELEWSALTRGRGELCTKLAGCEPADPGGCSCAAANRGDATLLLWFALLFQRRRRSSARTNKKSTSR